MNTQAVCGVALALAISALSGCFAYVPAERQSVPEGEEVRVYVTRSVLDDLPAQVPADDGAVLAGRLVQRDEQGLTLRVPVRGRQEGFRRMEIGQNVRVPAGDVVEIQRRELDVLNTGFLLAAAAGAATGAVLMIMDASGSPPEDPGTPPELIGVPVFSVPFW